MPPRLAGKAKGFQDSRYRALIERLIARRQELGLTQAKLGALLGNHQQFVGRYELGERRLDVVEFIDIAKVLNISVDEIIEELNRDL